MRFEGRAHDQLRSVRMTPGFIGQAEGSVLIEVGRTRVICTASVEEAVPSFLKGQGKGWITSEYSMIPRATNTRTARESTVGKKSGRTQEIQRLIGRALRAAIELEKLGERQIWIDCDVIEADGGTRTASITGAFVAVSLAIKKLMDSKILGQNPIRSHVAAVSVGVIKGVPMLDLDYSEDSTADVDFNIVMTDRDEFVEIQGTAERFPFSSTALSQLLELGRRGIHELIDLQRKTLQL
ncbi:MAG TPA: ribonuclease PH [Terriglobia bacterium]|nr:ribonuclease PH [Terriglobia bacterium]